MFFSALIGMMLGLGQLSAPVALLVLALAISAKIVVDLRWHKTPVIGTTSPYIKYCENLERAGESIEQAWLSYAIQLFFFGGIIGTAFFVLMRWLR